MRPALLVTTRALLLAGALLAGVAPLAAHAASSTTDGSQIAPGNAMLTVSADGQAHRMPDVAVFSAGVTTQGKTASAALAANSQAMTAVIAELKKAGVQSRDIQTSNLSVSPLYEEQTAQPTVRPRHPIGPVIIGYQVANQVNVRQRKLDAYGATIDALVSAGANQINGPSFTVDDPAAALDEARLEAIKAARARADLYAKAAGLRVLRIVSIAESGGGYQQPMMFARAKVMSAAAPVEAGEVELAAHVTVQFELAP